MSATVKKLDFTDVRDQGNFNRRRKPAGEYRAKVVEVVDHESKEGNPNFLFTIQVDGDRRASYPYYCGLEVKQLWKLRNLLVATGLKPPTGRSKIDPNKIVGRSLGILLEDDEYEGRVNSTVADIFPLSEGGEFLNEGASSKKSTKSRPVDDDDEDDDEEDEPAKKSKSKKKPPPPDDEDEDDDEDEEPAPKKSAKKSSKKAPPPEEDDDEDDEEDDEDEEPEPPKKSKKKVKASLGKKSRRRTSDDDDDDLDTDDL